MGAEGIDVSPSWHGAATCSSRHKMAGAAIGGRTSVDDIVEPTVCSLFVPYGRMLKKKTMAMGVAFPDKCSTMYDDLQILLDYVMVTMTNPEYEVDELDLPL